MAAVAAWLGIAQRRLSRIFAQNDDYQEAVARPRMLWHEPQQVATRLMLANLLERSKDLEAAKTELQRVLDFEPDQWRAAYRLGRLHLRVGELVVAGQVFRDAAELAPGKAAPQLALAAALKGIGEIDQALLVLRKAQKLPSAPSSVAMMILRATHLPKVLINQPISNRQGCCTSSQNSGSASRDPSSALEDKLGTPAKPLRAGRASNAIRRVSAVGLSGPSSRKGTRYE